MLQIQAVLVMKDILTCWNGTLEEILLTIAQLHEVWQWARTHNTKTPEPAVPNVVFNVIYPFFASMTSQKCPLWKRSILHAGSLSHCQVLGHLNRTEMLLVTPVLLLLWQLKMSAVKKASRLQQVLETEAVKWISAITKENSNKIAINWDSVSLFNLKRWINYFLTGLACNF